MLLVLFHVDVIKGPDKKNLRDKESIELTVPGDSPPLQEGHGGRDLKQLVMRHPQSGAQSNELAQE